MQVIEFDLPFKVSTNEIYAGTHWSKRKQHKDLMLWAMLGMKKFKPVEKCELEFNFEFANRPLDNTNCGYLAKLCEDCLVHYKILTDDNYKIVQSLKITSRKSKDKKDRVTITIKEAENEN